MKDGHSVTPHSNEWYDRLATLQDGYFYPWRPRIGSGNGEEAYLELVDDYLTPATDVLEVACGHGEHALSIASKCRSVLAYDRVRPYIDLAEKNPPCSGNHERHVRLSRLIGCSQRRRCDVAR